MVKSKMPVCHDFHDCHDLQDRDQGSSRTGTGSQGQLLDSGYLVYLNIGDLNLALSNAHRMPSY